MGDGSVQTGRQVLAANEAFYRAFAERDFEGMEALWAAETPVSCIHPGWNAVRGRERVIASWRAILSSPDAPAVAAANVTAHLLGDAAYVICEERINNAMLIATNVFVLEGEEWKLTHHQAGQVLARATDEQTGGTDGSIN